MKRTFTILLILSSMIAYTQSTFRPASVSVNKDCAEADIAAYNSFVNKFFSTNLRFLRIQNTLSANWTSAYCDCELCHSVTTDSADFFIKVGDSCTTSGHFYPLDTKGSGTIKIKVFDPNNRSDYVIGEYIASCSTAGFVFLEREQLKVTPNPATTSLNICFGSAEPYTLNIISAEGKLLMKQNVDGLNNNINISVLNPGLYSVKVESSGKVFFAKFIKL